MPDRCEFGLHGPRRYRFPKLQVAYVVVAGLILALAISPVLAEDQVRPDPILDSRGWNGSTHGDTRSGLYPSPTRAREIQEFLRERSTMEFGNPPGPSSARLPSREAYSITTVGAPAADTLETWTFLFYDDADFHNAYDPLNDFSADAHSYPNVNVIVLQDTNSGPAWLWYVNELSQAVLLEGWGEVDMGNPATLRDFINYGKANYPADRYLLAMYDHGGGWSGACVDITNGGWLDMNDIHSGLYDAGGVDILCFTAPCLMGAAESAYELRDVVDVYIGSEELSGYVYWWGIMGGICDVLENSSEISNEVMGEIIIWFVENNTWWPDREWMTMSAISSDGMESVARCVNTLSSYLTEHVEEEICASSLARDRAWELGMGGQYDPGAIDLYDFAQQYAAIATEPTVQLALQDLMDTLDLAVVAECHGPAQERVYGLSVYFPRDLDHYDPEYESCLLDFADHTTWDEFLGQYYACPACNVAVEDQNIRLTLTGYPNPFRSSVNIGLANPASGRVNLRVFDVAGRLVRTLCEHHMEAGVHSVLWDGRDGRGDFLPTGVYLCRMETRQADETAKVHISR